MDGEEVQGGVLVKVELTLPRDARYVPVMRDLATCLFKDLGAGASVVDDLQVALSEACGNVVRHAEGSDEYQVTFSVAEEGCEIEVSDVGPGFNPRIYAESIDDPIAEEGRGLFLMNALVDDLSFTRTEDGQRVRLFKRWPALDLQGADTQRTS